MTFFWALRPSFLAWHGSCGMQTRNAYRTPPDPSVSLSLAIYSACPHVRSGLPIGSGLKSTVRVVILSRRASPTVPLSGSDVVYADVMGSHIIILNSMKAARDLLEKRSSIYSDRYDPRWCLFPSTVTDSTCLPLIGRHWWHCESCMSN
jgi:hypothetical protein